MIPDDAVIIIRQAETSVSVREREPGRVVYAAVTGFPGTLVPEHLLHMKNYGNPHGDKITELVFSLAESAGKWFIIGAEGVAITDERPVYPDEIHPRISADEMVKLYADTEPFALRRFAGYPLRVAGGLRLEGDEMIGARMIYGTNANGSFGFVRVPWKRVMM